MEMCSTSPNIIFVRNFWELGIQIFIPFPFDINFKLTVPDRVLLYCI